MIDQDVPLMLPMYSEKDTKPSLSLSKSLRVTSTTSVQSNIKGLGLGMF